MGAKEQPAPAAEFRALSWNSAGAFRWAQTQAALSTNTPHSHSGVLTDRGVEVAVRAGLGWAGREGGCQRSNFLHILLPAQLEQSEAKCEDALKTQKVLTADLENMHSELENVTRSKSLVLSHTPRPQSPRSTGSGLA